MQLPECMGSYLDDGTFSDIAEDVVALYLLQDGEDVSKVTKEIQFSHRLIKAET